MIRHTFKKDWKLLWPMVVGVALINLIERVIRSNIGFRIDPFSPLQRMSWIFEPVSLLAIGILIVTIVQQDALPGLRQDWLVRPVQRRDLMLSKILFIVLAVQCPIFITEVGQGLATGFLLPQSLGAPFSRSLWMLLAMDLPLLAFATLTRNLVEAVGAGLVVFLGASFFTTSTMRLAAFSGIAWVADSLQLIWCALAVAIVLGLQYYRRKTVRARWMYGGAVLVWLFAQLLPWQAAFAVQERFSPSPAAADSVQIGFDPGLRERFKLLPGRDTRVFGRPVMVIYVPLRVTDGGYSGMLIADRMTARFTGPDGRVVDLGSQLSSDRLTRGESYQETGIPADVYERIKDRPVRMEMD
jgi:hypothetical protein